MSLFKRGLASAAQRPCSHLKSDSAFVRQRVMKAFKGRDTLGGNQQAELEKGRQEDVKR